MENKNKTPKKWVIEYRSFSVRIPQELAKKIEKKSIKEKRSFNRTIEQILENSFNSQN